MAVPVLIDLTSFLMSVSPYLAIATAIVLPVVLWGRSVSEKLNLIKDNHLAHIEKHTEQTNDILIEIKTILQERK